MPYDPVDNTWAKSAALTSLTATAGTANDTLVDGGATYSQTIFNDNFRDVAAKVNAILAALREAEIIAD